jgi:virulence-associated protein VagC
MTLQEIKDSVEVFIEGKKSVILPLQQAWSDTHEKFWQGLRTPTIIPEDGAQLPTDQTLARYPLPSWFSFGITLPTLSHFSVSCDERVDSDCCSFSLVCRFRFGDVGYSKQSSWCEGDGWVDVDWEMQEPLDLEPPE